MHLFLENHCKSLVSFWTGKYKGLDEGKECYVIAPAVWDAIGCETAEASNTIPSTFGRRTPNIATEQHIFTAEDWSFWTLFIAPYVLDRRFFRPKYYKHFMKFHSIMKTTLQFSFTDAELGSLHERVIDYIQEYESIYYQFKPDRLSVCTLAVHALLHIADDIKTNGPPCYNWTFVMERWCQHLLPAVKSHKRPFVSLAMRQYHLALFNEIQTRYELFEALQLTPSKKELSHYEVVYKEYPHSILQPPRRGGKPFTDWLRNLVAAYLTTVFNIRISTAKRVIPETFTAWGKVRIANGGDCIRVKSAQDLYADRSQDASFVCYEVLADRNAFSKFSATDFVRIIHYGTLEMILEIIIPPNPSLRTMEPRRFILALVSDCKTDGKDAAKDIVTFTKIGPCAIVDLAAICAVVGCFKYG
ncbi:uncharacterized protein EI90DRAFT_2933090 [Cantharellus anzutake]|uniref:uncharacterized protein n=1 Tax=Cantharellus anzutake TaxID=1750568 RepID=UPI0019087E2F|nr:uncharacterized protein EI90DRAFT_2933090 [Cantharellus anzutake]KAF8325103.1 hypothetical protein EI90DRAFT_2933090 [Cantharellus anzutake]